MTLKKKNIDNIGPLTPEEQAMGITEEVKEVFNTVEAREVEQDREMLAAKQAADIAAITNAVVDKMKDATTDNAMGAIDPAEYKKHQKGVSHIPSSDKKAYTGPLTPREREDMMDRLRAKQATAEDLANIDESMILDLPYIKASDFSIPGQYDPKPKDPAIRFRWVNCVNALQSNMQRFLALGFVPATPDDVDQEKTPLADSMIQGTQIKQYDVILMKINVMALMSLYKKNIQDSAFKLDSVTSGRMAEAAAGQAFSDLINSEQQNGVMNRYRVSTGKEPVTFSRS